MLASTAPYGDFSSTPQMKC